MEKFTYLFFLFIFSVPAIFILYVRHKKTVKRYRSLFLPAVMIFVCFDLIADPVGTLWRAWVYNTRLVSGTWLGGAVYETGILAGVLGIIFTFIVIVFAEKEEKKKSFWPFI